MLIRSSLTSNARYVMLQRCFHYWHNEWKVLENILQAFFIEIAKKYKKNFIIYFNKITMFYIFSHIIKSKDIMKLLE